MIISNNKQQKNKNSLSVYMIGAVAIIALVMLCLLFVGLLIYNIELSPLFIYFVKHRWYFYLLFPLFICVVLYGLNKIKCSRKVFLICLGVYALLLFIFAYLLALWPIFDSDYITRIASQIAEGDYSQFQPYGYVDLFPFQYGFIKYVLLMLRLFGQDNMYLAIQFFNVIFICGFIYFIVKISETFMFSDDNQAYIIGFAFMLFFPLAFFATYIYGIIPALFFSSASIYFLLSFMEGKGNRLCAIVFATLCNAISIMLKNNSIIIFIAQICVVIIYIAKNPCKKIIIKGCLLSASMIILTFLFSFCINKDLHSHTVSNHIGTPKSSWIAMGMQEGGPAEGWYNCYNRDVYWDNQCDRDIANKLSIESIKSSLNHFVDNPGYSIRFYSKKIISSWGNPSFEAFNLMEQSDLNNPNTVIKRSFFKRAFFHQKDNQSLDQSFKVLNGYLKIYELAILFGTIVFIVSRRLSVSNVIFIIIFIGGFMFHILWEAACQYMLLYFLILIPYGVAGLKLLSEKAKIILQK